MKRFKFMLIFGILAAFIFLSFNVSLTDVDKITVTSVTAENDGYLHVTGSFTSKMISFKGYEYNTYGDGAYIKIRSSFRLFGGSNEWTAKISNISDIKKIYVKDDKTDKQIFNR